MAKDKKKSGGKKAKAGQASKTGKKFRKATEKAAKLAANPLVAEVVAATLLAAAAAIRNPRKAREIAMSAGDELGNAAKGAVGQGNAFWKLAIDVAKRSVDALGEGQAPGPAKKAPVRKATVKKAAAKPRKAAAAKPKMAAAAKK
jgi:hypothetical protein